MPDPRRHSDRGAAGPPPAAGFYRGSWDYDPPLLLPRPRPAASDAPAPRVVCPYDAPARLTRDTTVAWPTCVRCGDRFGVTHGEEVFARTSGIPLPQTCRGCRPTRRQAHQEGVVR